MTWRFPVSKTDVNVIVNLGTSDDVLIAPGVVVASTDSNTIIGSGSSHQVEVYGTVANSAIGLAAIGLGGGGNISSGEFVHVDQGGLVLADTGFGVIVHGFDTTVINDGVIRSLAGIGVVLDGSAASGKSTLANYGTIQGAEAVDRESVFSPGQTIVLNNYGLIKGEPVAYGLFNGEGDPARDLITNNGTMIGTISLYSGDDLYDGRKGKATGKIDAGAGDDRIFGGREANTIDGGDGRDRISGGGGADLLSGGGDADLFIYRSIADSGIGRAGHDVLADFSLSEHDRIDLKAIDADSHTAKNQSFSFIGHAAFSHSANELRYEQSSTSTFIQADINGDGRADLSIELSGKIELHAGNFML